MTFTPTQQALLSRIKGEIRVEKIVSTCTVGNNKDGTSFLGYSCAKVSVKDESEMGLMDEGGTTGWTLTEAKIARAQVSLEATLGALEDGLIRGSIDRKTYDVRAGRAVKGYEQRVKNLLPQDEADQPQIARAV